MTTSEERLAEARADLVAVERQLAEAREALRRYGQHENACRYLDGWVDQVEPPCTCGLIAELVQAGA